VIAMTRVEPRRSQSLRFFPLPPPPQQSPDATGSGGSGVFSQQHDML
jgi:hypothetical protein